MVWRSPAVGQRDADQTAIQYRHSIYRTEPDVWRGAHFGGRKRYDDSEKGRPASLSDLP